jgi:adenosine deaminase
MTLIRNNVFVACARRACCQPFSLSHCNRHGFVRLGRPHCGESGETHHLSSAYLVVDGVNHGIQLQNAPVMQYLYYLTQVYIYMYGVSFGVLKDPKQHMENRKFAIVL